jgi:hypothetical protein
MYGGLTELGRRSRRVRYPGDDLLDACRSDLVKCEMRRTGTQSPFDGAARA